MARIWVEEFQDTGVPIDCLRHNPELNAGARNRVPQDMMLVVVASFTFRFISADQIRSCLAYYERKTHPSSAHPIGAMDHWEAQRWFERLPMYLLEEPKRAKVVKALKRALAIVEAGALTEPQASSSKRSAMKHH